MKRFLLPYALLLSVAAGCSAKISQTVDGLAPPGQQSLPASSLPRLDLGEFAGLPGLLVVAQEEQGVIEYDLATGEGRFLFQPPERGLVAGASLPAEGGPLLLAYAPPPEEGGGVFGFSGLYVLPTEGNGQPQPVLEGVAGDVTFGPAWSPDGRFVYYGRFQSARVSDDNSGYTLERMAYPGGQPEVLLVNAYWPALSPDGSQLAYVFINRDAALDELYLADADGSNPRALLEEGQFEAVDAPRFSPDGQSILFSAIEAAPAAASAFDGVAFLTGAKVARAHNEPADLWTVAISGGPPTRLVRLGATGIRADYAPDGQAIAFVSGDGITFVRPDGSGLVRAATMGGLVSLEWRP